jgi:hypothetical protein
MLQLGIVHPCHLVEKRDRDVPEHMYVQLPTNFNGPHFTAGS